MLRLVFISLAFLFIANSHADVLQVKKNSPTEYIVVKGDTLWDISAKFLNTPWRWPELWGYNSQIADPHWIYPGDKISLIYVDGKPRLIVNQAKPALTMTRHGRKSNKRRPIPTVALKDIEHYLTHQRVVAASKVDELPILVGSERDAIYYQKSDIIFANQTLKQGVKYGVYRKGRHFISPQTQQHLGQELELVATARVTMSAAISRLSLLSVESEVSNGHVMMPLVEDDLPLYFMPKAASKHIRSSIVGSAEHFREAGQNDVVIIDGGTQQGINAGSVFSVFQPGKIQFVGEDGEVRDPANYRRYDKVKAYFVDDEVQRLPNVYRGQVMVFRSFENISYALVTKIDRPIRTGDDLINP
ncbi:peptidoglycan-binding protein LysM [Alteromonadales bacterium alter-6D02]|nr:peptidoglycan-binding protein LysM [Alteromonadales bacterium alter-6D02]